MFLCGAPDFQEKYIKLFAMRSIYSSLTVEEKNFAFSQPQNAPKVLGNMEAFQHALEFGDRQIGPYDAKDIADIINKYDNDGTPNGFRRVDGMVQGSNVVISSPHRGKMISDLYYLFHNYYKVWDILKPYEREAKFHLEFTKIHPFEDGNGRTARIITCRNLMIQNKAPIIIGEEDRDYYLSLLQNEDVDGLAEFFRQKSEEEMKVVFETMNLNNEQVFGVRLPESDNEKINDIETLVLKNNNKLE